MNSFSRHSLPLFVATFLLLNGNVYGQAFLEGSWKGKYTYGIQNDFGYPFEIFLRIDGRKITGRSYLVTPDKRKVEMDISGYLFQDLSFIIEETAIDKSPETSENTFFRKYQLRFKGDIWTKSLEGYWQEIIQNDFDKTRKVGRVLLTKEKENKA